jgi:hypothetical protein
MHRNEMNTDSLRNVVVQIPEEWVYRTLFVVLIGLYVSSILSMHVFGGNFPLVGVKSILEPRIVANYRFFKNNVGVVNEGYKKVCVQNVLHRA